MAKTWVSPLQKMIASEDTLALTVEDVKKDILANTKNETFNFSEKSPSNQIIIEINPEDCIKWQFKDRPENELGNIDELSESIKNNGQIHPVLIRKASHHLKPYELIVGERRWLAVKKAHLPLKAILMEDLSDQKAALVQAEENDKRKDLSDYAKGLMLRQQIDAKIITAKDIEFNLKKSQSYVRNLLSFSRLDSAIILAIGDMRSISARTAYDLVRWQEKGEDFKFALIKLAPLLRKGNIGEKKLEKLIFESVNYINHTTKNVQSGEVLSENGRHLFSWRGDTNKNLSISFPKSIRTHINFKVIEKTLIKTIEDQLQKKG